MIDVSSFVKTLGEKPVAVYGLGISNLAAIMALKEAGAHVIAGDDFPDRLKAARDLGAETPPSFPDFNFSRYACMVLAPGVPNWHLVVKKSLKAKIEILCDVEILHRCLPACATIGITGTNGKSTTTALTGHILKSCGIPSAVGGNIGIPALALDPPPQNGTLVLELSSFQLDLCPSFAPTIGVHLNLTPDHIDRHNTIEAYEAAKLRIFRGKGDAVIGIDDEPSRHMLQVVQAAGERRIYPVSVISRVENGVFVENGMLFDSMNGPPEEKFRLDMPFLPGLHNMQNAAAAYVAARLSGCAPEAIHAALKTFPGLNHRQFPVRVINGVAYINDSKATNADAAARALACYSDIFWIAGGQAKKGGLAALEPYKGRIRHAFLIGEAAPEFAQWCAANAILHTVSETLDRAVQDAHDLAQQHKTGTVLLSPACASFDQFKNFEERGDAFAGVVNSLKEMAA